MVDRLSVCLSLPSSIRDWLIDFLLILQALSKFEISHDAYEDLSVRTYECLTIGYERIFPSHFGSMMFHALQHIVENIPYYGMPRYYNQFKKEMYLVCFKRIDSE